MRAPLSRRAFASSLGAGFVALARPRASVALGAPASTAAAPYVGLDSNENPYGPSTRALAALAPSPSAAARYPDAGEDEVRAALARLHGVTLEQVVLGCGSTEVLKMAAAAFLGPDKRLVAAEPTLGQAGYWLMTVTALFATAGATNSGLYPATGLADEMAARGQFPPAMGARVAERASAGIVVTAIAAIILAVFFDLNAIASIGSAVALIVFALVTLGHLRIRRDTGANLVVLLIADLSTIVVLISSGVGQMSAR